MSATYDDFKKLDIRVANILKAEKILGKTKIIKGTIDLGKETRSVVIANLETKKIAGIESNAMLLAADVDNKPFWLTVSSEVQAGTKIK